LVECLLGLAGAEKDVGKVIAGLVVVGVGLQLGAPLGHLGLQILRATATLVRQLRPQLHGRDGLSHRGIAQLGLVLVLKSNNNQLESALQQHNPTRRTDLELLDQVLRGLQVVLRERAPGYIYICCARVRRARARCVRVYRKWD